MQALVSARAVCRSCVAAPRRRGGRTHYATPAPPPTETVDKNAEAQRLFTIRTGCE